VIYQDARDFKINNLIIYMPYDMYQKGPQVVALQNTLLLNITGIYDINTRKAHLNKLLELGAPTNNIPILKNDNASSPPQQNISEICSGSAAREFAHKILDPYNIPIPSITVISNISRSGYGPGGAAILMPPCESESGLAHEIGHYVYDYYFNLNWNLVIIDAEKNFTSTNWIRSKEISPGIERSAHCIGNVLWGYGTYTKCPDSTMKSYAEKIIAESSNR
jgi:hypothetical protein